MHRDGQTTSQESIASSHEDWGDFESQRRRRSTGGGHQQSPRLQLNMFPIDIFSLLLISGCCLALLSQYMARIGVALPATQLMTWTRFAFKLTCSSLMDLRLRPTSAAASSATSQRNHQGTITAMGLLDVLGYTFSSWGFQALGSSVSIVIASALAQIITALTRRLILKRKLSAQQMLGVAAVTVGLAVRGIGIKTAPSPLLPGQPLRPSLPAGCLYLFLSALCYAMVGIGFEWLMLSPHPPDNALIQRKMSLIGTLAVSFYIIIYVLPHRQAMVLDRIKDVNGFFILLLYSTIGVIFTGHSFVQARCIKSRGIVAVNIVNALRSVAVTLLSALLFCSAKGDRECLTTPAILGALLVCSGVVVFSTSKEEKTKGRSREKKE